MISVPSSLSVLGLIIVVQSAAAQVGQCSYSQPTIVAPHSNPWKALSAEETDGVNVLLQDKLGLTGFQGSSKDSYVVQIALLNPNKTDVLPFLDNNATSPERYARATVASGATNVTELFWQEYLVGPLPATNGTVVEPLTYLFQNQDPGKTAVHPVFSSVDAVSLQTRISVELEDITRELWNGTILEGQIGVRFGVPFWEEDGRIIAWVSFFANPTLNVSSPTLLALGVATRLDLTGRNPEDWKTTAWYSRGKYYDTTQDFRDAVFSPDFEKPPPNVDGNWASTDQQGEPWPLDNLPPPVSISQGNQRFSIDIEEGYVSWMDFSFYLTVSQDVGLSLFDINFKGKRLIYELSLQEAVTNYAGSDPFASQATFFDSETGMGSTLITLIRGYDCPSHATYLNATFTDGNSTRTQVDAICIFEYDAGYPIRRHSFQPAAAYTSVAKNIVFTVRTIATVGNYDFLIEYNFLYDGSIEVSARASGYISATYWEGNEDYGFHIHDYLSGSLHDHVLTFKADFDVLGAKNSVQRIELVPESTEYPWTQGRIHNTFKASRSFISDESESSIKWAGNDAVMYAVVNKDTPNRFGEYPGYRIKRSAGTTHLTTINSTDTLKAAAYATHDFYITKQKDSEPRAADAFNQFAPGDPLVDFATFFDDESLEQEDVVVWFNLGMHHMPHTGDLPNTMFTAAHSAIRFEPLNYLEGDPSVASNQQVRISYDAEGSVVDVEEFGKTKSSCNAS